MKAVIAAQIAEEMKKQHIIKARMAEMMQTNRAQLDWLLDPGGGSATLESLMRALASPVASCGSNSCKMRNSRFLHYPTQP